MSKEVQTIIELLEVMDESLGSIAVQMIHSLIKANDFKKMGELREVIVRYKDCKRTFHRKAVNKIKDFIQKHKKSHYSH